MDKYNEFMRYKKWSKAVQKISIDMQTFDANKFVCDEAVHTLEIVFKNNCARTFVVMICISSNEKIFETLSRKIKFVRNLIINGFSSYNYSHTYSISGIHKFLKTIIIKNLIIKNDNVCNTEILRIHSNIPNIKFSQPKFGCIALQEVFSNEYIRQINIEGLDIYTKLIIPNGSDYKIIDILRQADNNRIAYNTLMTSIQFVYLARHSGLFALLPATLIDYIISKIRGL